MTKDEAIKILLRYAERDEADSSLAVAIKLLKSEEAISKLESMKNFHDNSDNIIVNKNFPRYFEIAVNQRQVITYKVLHNSIDEAIDEVQKKVKDRDWKAILQFPPGSPNYSPIPFFDYDIESVSVKEDVLRPNPHSEGGSSDT